MARLELNGGAWHQASLAHPRPWGVSKSVKRKKRVDDFQLSRSKRVL